MRDIRADLKERLAHNEAKRSRLTTELRQLESGAAVLMQLLELEDREFSSATAPTPSTPLADFIVEEAGRRHVTKDELRTAARARGYDTDGRSIHAHVNNLIRAGRLEEVQPGSFGIPDLSAEKRAPPALAEMFGDREEVTTMPPP